MTALVIILIVLQALTLWVAVAMSNRQKHHIDQLESDLMVNKQLYDRLEEQVAKQYEILTGLNTKKTNKKQ